MKKGVLLGIMLLLLITGCTTKEEKIICTRTSTMNNMEMDLRYEIFYQGTDVNKVATVEKVITDDEETLKQLETQTKSLYANFDNIKNYHYNITVKNNTFTSTTDINYQKIDIDELVKIDSSIQQLLNENNKVDVDKITQIYTQTGATCKKQ